MTPGERRRVADAGYISVLLRGREQGWVPVAFAERVDAEVERVREAVAAAAAEPRRRGRRPKKEEMK